MNNVEFTEDHDICNCLNNYFCNVGKNLALSIQSSPKTFNEYCESPTINSMFCDPTNKNEILNIISGFYDNKSPEPDSIGPKLLKLISANIVEPFMYICNLSFATGKIPQALKIAKVIQLIPIFKKGEKDKPGNYRPISLLSIFDKILEKLMFKRLYGFLTKHKILYDYQFGFRKGHSTSLALIELLDTIYSHCDNNEIVIGMHFDLQKAFDTIDHSILLYKLNSYGVRGVNLHWFKDYLSNRKQFVSIANTTSSLQCTSCGVPQGSVLGPLLFLLYVNDIKNSIDDCTVKLFADDTNLFVHGKTLREVFLKANDAVARLSKWFMANKLSLSIDKTCYSVFGSKSSDVDDYDIKIDDTVLKSVKCTKYLGVLIDSELTWKEHIDHLYRKLLKFSGVFYRLRHILPYEVLKMIYFAFVYPQVLYGIEVYANTCKSYLKKLTVLNNKLLRIVQNRHIKTRVANLYKTFNTLPVSALHHYQLLLFVHKCLYCNHMMPNIFNGYFARNSSLYTRITRSYHKLHMYSVRSTYGLRCSRFKASQLWNNLPTKLTNINSNYIFKRELKYHMLQNMGC